MNVSGNADTGRDAQATIDVARLRRERLARCFAAMDAHDLDALVLGREGNVRYASDARRLWLSGSRPFGPSCVLVRATRELHLLSTSSAGVPDDIPRAHLYPLTWDPDALVARLARIPGLRAARRVGVDGWTAAAGRLLARVAPDAELVDGDAPLRAARSVKTRDEVACIRAAAAVASAGLDAVIGALGPDASETTLRAAFVERIAARGVTIPASEQVVHPAVRPPLIALRCGVLLDGYEATVVRTWPRDPSAPRGTPRELVERWRGLRARLTAACRPGASARDLLAAYDAHGAALPPFPIAHGVGLGSEPPSVGARHVCDPAWRIAEGMVLALTAFVQSRDGHAFLSEDVVHVAAHGGEVLTPAPDGPLANA